MYQSLSFVYLFQSPPRRGHFIRRTSPTYQEAMTKWWTTLPQNPVHRLAFLKLPSSAGLLTSTTKTTNVTWAANHRLTVRWQVHRTMDSSSWVSKTCTVFIMCSRCKSSVGYSGILVMWRCESLFRDLKFTIWELFGGVGNVLVDFWCRNILIFLSLRSPL